MCKKKNYWWFDAILLVLTGLPGPISLHTMIFSQHPTVQINLPRFDTESLNLIFASRLSREDESMSSVLVFELLDGFCS